MNRLQQLFSHQHALKFVPLAMLIGVGGAFGALIFHTFIAITTQLFFGTTASATFMQHAETLPTWYRVLLPAFGGLCVGVLYKITRVPEAEGEGVPEVIESLAIERGRIRPFVAPVKTLASAITIGSGGSAGREGPIIQIGSAIGSNIGQLLKLHTRETSLLLAAGAAAGIAGTFSAPLAGVIFSVEVLRARSDAVGFLIMGIAAIVSAMIAQALGLSGITLTLSVTPTFAASEFFLFFLLGIGGGLVAVFFVYTLRAVATIFKLLHFPEVLRPALGGLVVGCITLLVPHIYEPAALPFMMNTTSLEMLPVMVLMIILLAKIVATACTLGSGGSGGVFAPALFIGLIAGSLFDALSTGFPIAGADHSLFALLGMAAVFAGIAHAPFTSMVILYEFTGEPLFLPALLMVSYLSYTVAKKLLPESIYHHS